MVFRKLFLASVAANTLNYILPLLPAKPKNCKVAFIPTAADPYAATRFVDKDRRKFAEIGFNVIDIDLKGKNEKQLLEKLKNADVIFVSGGNTFYLLEKARQSGFDKTAKSLVKKGVIYAGSSAGSVLAGPTIEPIKLLDDPSKARLKSCKSLGLVDFIVIPHFDSEEYGPKCKKILSEYKGKFKLLPLKDSQAVIVEGSSVKVVG